MQSTLFYRRSLIDGRSDDVLGFAAHGVGRLYAGVQTKHAFIAKLVLVNKNTLAPCFAMGSRVSKLVIEMCCYSRVA